MESGRDLLVTEVREWDLGNDDVAAVVFGEIDATVEGWRK